MVESSASRLDTSEKSGRSYNFDIEGDGRVEEMRVPCHDEVRFGVEGEVGHPPVFRVGDARPVEAARMVKETHNFEVEGGVEDYAGTLDAACHIRVVHRAGHLAEAIVADREPNAATTRTVRSFEEPGVPRTAATTTSVSRTMSGDGDYAPSARRPFLRRFHSSASSRVSGPRSGFRSS